VHSLNGRDPHRFRILARAAGTGARPPENPVGSEVMRRSDYPSMIRYCAPSANCLAASTQELA